MHWLDWSIILIPFFFVMYMAFYARRYARDVVDFLAVLYYMTVYLFSWLAFGKFPARKGEKYSIGNLKGANS